MQIFIKKFTDPDSTFILMPKFDGCSCRIHIMNSDGSDCRKKKYMCLSRDNSHGN